MNLHTFSVASAPHRPLSFAILRNLAVVAGLSGVISASTAADSPPSHSAAPGISDVVLARAALAALDAEAELKGVNLVVSVVDGVAVIGGPVPSTAISRRAERIVRGVEGLKEVRNTCFVSTGPDPLLKAVAVKAGSSLPPRPVMGELPGVLTNQLPPPVSPFPPNTIASAVELDSTVVVRKPPFSTGSTANILGAPVGPGGPVGTASPASPTLPTTTPGTLTSAPPGGLLKAASEMRKTEARFTNLSVELQGGVLMVGGSAPRASDAWDFAQKLRQLPGVSRVAIGAVAGK